MKKKSLLIALLLIAVGFAAVSTTLLINGTSILKKNDADFKVYYSNALVNGVEDKSVIVNDKQITFSTTLNTLGQTYVLDYDVTNSSKNYDADLDMTCIGGNEYLTVTNVFDTTDNLLATDTRSGKLTLTLAKSYTGDDLDVNITCTIGANAVERTELAVEMINFTIDGKQYTVAEGTTWKEFIDSGEVDELMFYYDEIDPSYIICDSREIYMGHSAELIYNPSNLPLGEHACSEYGSGSVSSVGIYDVIVKNGVYNNRTVFCLGGGGMMGG